MYKYWGKTLENKKTNDYKTIGSQGLTDTTINRSQNYKEKPKTEYKGRIETITSITATHCPDTETNPTIAKVPDKKEVKMDLAQLQLLLDKFALQFEDATKRIIKANKGHIAHNCTLPKNNQNQQNEYYNKNNQSKKQKVQISKNNESGDHNKDDADELFDELEYKSEELEELERFLFNCVLSNKESAKETRKSKKIVKTKSLAVYLAVIEKILTRKKVTVEEKLTIEE
ncbi:14447_t:CDS:2 [Dentiscutata heterogama]|uniref:14447_t:CDS:1 n=1 Tax=Dentiscutata heterogama TaxID=1316150 RepID=A0ACA9KGW1_9GLOM|nr:14447_t:CDS:2 [Dentiscutata heterogama]